MRNADINDRLSDVLQSDGGAAALPSVADLQELSTVGSDLPAPVQATEPIDLGGDDADGGRERTLRDAVIEDVKVYFAAHEADESFADNPSEAFIESNFFDFSFTEGVEPVEHYWVNKPFAFVSVLYDSVESEYRYHVSEPVLDGFEEYVHSDLTKVLRNSLLYRDLTVAGDRAEVFETEAKHVIAAHAATVEDGSLHKLLYYLLRDFIHYGKIDPLMRDGSIEDISCDGSEVPIFIYHGTYRDLATNVAYPAGALTSFTVRLAQRAGKQISISDPLVDASLPDGSRVQLTLGSDISTRGSNFTIRKFSDVPYTPVDLIRWNTFSADEMAYFWLAIENNKSLLFAGGTGSGKTTSMNAISFFIPGYSKVVSIEDTREITLPHENWIQSVTRDTFTADGRGEVSMYALLQAALRQRPEYLLVGEIRTEKRVALTFFHAIATGHTAYSTFHGDSVDGVLNRLRNEPLGVPGQMLEGLDVISVQKQIHVGDDRLRRNVAISELVSDDDGSVDVVNVFQRDPKDDVHRGAARSTVLADIADERGWTSLQLEEELRNRADLLRYMVAENVDDYRDVAATIQAYLKDPEGVLAGIRADEHLPAVVERVEVGARDADRASEVSDRANEANGGADREGEGGVNDAAHDEELAREMFAIFDEADPIESDDDLEAHSGSVEDEE